ncbi:hypothetical protein M422DRAFT_40387 [Sphaerobolus stellatus SS14]|nr:hypothetical protein M422DRAFT_40387 [Sphaerobolus stellatus SS14]
MVDPLSHQSTIIDALRTISPGLAALHASRLTRKQHALQSPEQRTPLTPRTCTRCGYASLSVRVRTRSTSTKGIQPEGNKNENKKNKEKASLPTRTRTRVLERTCPTCGFVEAVPLPRGNAQLYTSVRRRVSAPIVSRSEMQPVPQAQIQAQPCIPSPSPSVSASSSKANSMANSPVPASPVPKPEGVPPKRNKKKSGLQELLARNRAREEQEKNKMKKGTAGSLSSFLEDL